MRFPSLSILFVLLIGAAVQAQEQGGGGGGGQYWPPLDSSPGVSKDNPGPSTEPTEPEEGGKRTKGLPTTGRSPSAAGAGMSGAGSRGGSARGGASGGMAGAFTGADFPAEAESWEWWWENNKAEYLALKSRLTATTTQTGSVGQLTGRGRPSEARGSRRPTFDAIDAEVLPALRELITGSDNRDIIAAALVAMARSTRDDAMHALLTAATPRLAHGELTVQAAATLALGIAGSRAALPALDALARDSAEGRELVGGGSVPDGVRAFGALAQGLIGDPSAVAGLIDVIESTPDAQRGLKVAAIVALGLVRDAPTGEACDYLVRRLGDRKLDAGVRSSIPIALGKLGNAEAVSPLLKLFLDPDTDNLVRESAAIGLGQLAGLQQKDVIAALRHCIEEGKDQQTRQFCLISLAQIGGRAAESDAESADLREQHADLAKLFAREISKPSHAGHRSWAALAAALYARKDVDAQPLLAERLMEAWEKEKDPSFKGAFALALGLMHVQVMAPSLYADFQQSKDPGLRGYTAVALGFLNYTDAAEALRLECASRTATPAYRLQVATGLGLLRDVQTVQALIETLRSSDTAGTSAAVATALGLIGDAEALGPLEALARDASRPALVRAYACVALGAVCEKTDLPWSACVNANSNYRAAAPGVSTPLSFTDLSRRGRVVGPR